MGTLELGQAFSLSLSYEQQRPFADLTAEARVPFQTYQSGIYGGHTGIGTGFFPLSLS
jgi:hypothetical protein